MSEKTDNKSPKRETNRIDLTQFEGIGNEKHTLLIEKTPTDGFHWSVGFQNDVEASMSVSSEFGKEIHEEADRFYHAIDRLPDLIAELKRTYAMLDAIAYEVAQCRECGGHREEEGLFHDCQNYCRCEEFNASQ